jgi:hypothetical protein
MNDLLGNLQMLEMALNQLKEYSSNEWVVGGGYRYNINTVLYQIKEGEPIHAKSKMFDETGVASSGCSETYSEQMQDKLEPIGGISTDWTFHTTDDDCEFEDG